jgi:putative PIN family toxin of toxin-antitoxin system
MSGGVPARVVLDTNVLLDFWVFDERNARPLRAALERGLLQALRCGSTVDEFSEVLGRPALRVANERRCTILRDWHRLAVHVEHVFAAPFACTDRQDQKFLDLAHSARAEWLVTRDKALLRLARRARRSGLEILAPDDALARVAAVPS